MSDKVIMVYTVNDVSLTASVSFDILLMIHQHLSLIRHWII